MRFYMLDFEEYGCNFMYLYNPEREYSEEEFRELVFQTLRRNYAPPSWTDDNQSALEEDVANLSHANPDIPRHEWVELVRGNIISMDELTARRAAEDKTVEELREEHGFIPVVTDMRIALETEFWRDRDVSGDIDD